MHLEGTASLAPRWAPLAGGTACPTKASVHKSG